MFCCSPAAYRTKLACTLPETHSRGQGILATRNDMATEPLLIYHCRDHGLVRKVYEQGQRRWLSFGDEGVQSIIDLEDAAVLVSPVCRAMLAVLLFIPAPRQALLLGAGGATLARYLQNHRAAIQGDCVEVSSAVAEIADKYFQCPGKNQGWRMIVADAREHIEQCQRYYDLVFLDIGDEGVSPAWLFEPLFLGQCRKTLRRGGALVINIIQESAEKFASALWNIRQTFDLRTVCLSVPEHRNILVFAFNGVPQHSDLETLERRIPHLTDQWGLEFQQFWQRMKELNPRNSGIF